MSSKKQRKKLKEQYNKNKKTLTLTFHNQQQVKKDIDQVLSFLKTKPNNIVTRKEIINNTTLYDDSKSSVSRMIQAINYYTDSYIETVKGRGYIYHG